MVKDFDYFVDRNSSRVLDFFKTTKTRSDEIWMRQMTNASGEEWKDLRATFSPIFTSGLPLVNWSLRHINNKTYCNCRANQGNDGVYARDCQDPGQVCRQRS